MRLLLLGGMGFIGSTLTEFLLRNTEDEIIVVDTLEFGVDPVYFYNTLNHKRVRFIKADVSNLRVVYDLIKKSDVVVYLASLTLPNSAKEPGDAVFVNETAAEIISDCCVKLDKRMIFMSTCSNYGKSKKLVNEKAELLPVSIYAISKVDAEKYLLKNNPNVVVLRCATAYGVGAGRTRWDVLFNDFVRSAVLRGEIELFQGQAHRPICHVNDISKAITMVSHVDYDSSTVYNVGTSEQNYTKEELAKIVVKVTGVKLKSVQFNDTRDYKVDFSKIKKELGFTADHTPETAIPQLADEISKELQLAGVTT